MTDYPPRSIAAPGCEERDLGGYTATFHFADGSQLVVSVADAVAYSCGGGDGETRLELLGRDRRVITRGDLAALLRKASLI